MPPHLHRTAEGPGAFPGRSVHTCPGAVPGVQVSAMSETRVSDSTQNRLPRLSLHPSLLPPLCPFAQHPRAVPWKGAEGHARAKGKGCVRRVYTEFVFLPQSEIANELSFIPPEED